MNILYVTYALNGLLMVAMPIALGIYLTRKFNLSGRLWWIGAGVFVLSQVGHIPFNTYVINPLVSRLNLVAALSPNQILIISAMILGLSAGLWEELFRYGMYRWWAKDARSWGKGLLLGTGHGGAEAVLLGLLVLYSYVNLVMARNVDLATLVPADQLAAAQAQVSAYWSAPWYDTLLGALERLFALPVQICFSVLVLQTFIRKQWFWVWLAVGFHALVDASAVVAQNLISPYITEAIIGVFGVLSVLIIFKLRSPEPVTSGPAAPPSTPFKPKSVQLDS